MMLARVVLYCLLGGLPITIGALGAGHFALWWISGIVLAAAFVPVAFCGPRGVWAQFGVIAPALFVITVVCTWTEAMVFVPRFRPEALNALAGATITYLIVAAVLAMLARALTPARPAALAVHLRPVLSTLAMVAMSGVAYVVYYLVFGAITYTYFTRGFYPEATQQVAALGVWFWPMEFGRGALMAAAVLPIVYTLRLSRARAALAVGAILWIAGGLSPLLVPNALMGTTQRIIHIVEIFTQNAPLGITLVLLVRPGSRTRPLPTPSPMRSAAV